MPLPLRAWAEPLGTWGAWQKEQQPSHPRWERLLERRQRQGGTRRRPTLGAGEHALPASAGQRGRGRAGRPVRQQHERRHAAPALHSALRQQHFRQPRKQPRLLAVWLQSPGADQSHAAPLLLGPEPCDSAPVPEPNSRASSRSSGRQSRLPPPSYDQLARDIEAA